MTERRSSREAKVRETLVERGAWRRAIASVNQAISQRPRDDLLYRERAHLYLFLGKSHEARADFDATICIAASRQRLMPRGQIYSDLEWNFIGLTYWMEAHRELAIDYWRFTTRLLSTNRVAYSFQGGGIKTGLLLWFGAVHEGTAADFDLVQHFYQKRLESNYWAHNLASWPGPLVHFFLNRISGDELVTAASGPQELSTAHFALAIRSREARRHCAYWKHMEQAAPRKSSTEVYDFYNILPYFVAKYELDARAK